MARSPRLHHSGTSAPRATHKDGLGYRNTWMRNVVLPYSTSSTYPLLPSFYAFRLDGKSGAGHGNGTLVGLVTANEARSVAEDTARDARDLGEVGVANTAPSLGERLAVDKAVGRLGDTLDAPLGVGVLGRLGVENVEDLGGGLESGLNVEEVVLPGSRL